MGRPGGAQARAGTALPSPQAAGPPARARPPEATAAPPPFHLRVPSLSPSFRVQFRPPLRSLARLCCLFLALRAAGEGAASAATGHGQQAACSTLPIHCTTALWPTHYSTIRPSVLPSGHPSIYLSVCPALALPSLPPARSVGRRRRRDYKDWPAAEGPSDLLGGGGGDSGRDDDDEERKKLL